MNETPKSGTDDGEMADDSALWSRPATEIAARVRGGEITASEAVQAAIARLARVNPAINAVVDVFEEASMAEAAALDQRIRAGQDPGPLAGVPVTVKVNVDQRGHATTNGLRIQRDLVADADSPVVSNLRRAGAVIIGRTNTPAFSLRWFTRNSLHGHTRNPLNPALTPGGSSGGAAAAVAAGVGAIAHGTDIAGSIRYPAYACGVHGLRPTLGRVAAVNLSGADRHIGAQLTAVSGPLARRVSDLGLALAAMSVPDPRDPWSTPVAIGPARFDRRAALCVAPDGLEVAPAVVAALHEAASRLRDAGWSVIEVDRTPPMREAAAMNLSLWLSDYRRTNAEAVEREDDPDARFVLAQMMRASPPTDLNGFMDILQRRLAIVREWSLFLEATPLLLCPVSGELPFPDLLDVSSEAGFARVLAAQMPQVGLPLTGLPGLAVTTGRVESDGAPVPVGVQLVAGRFREDVLLAAGEAIEARGAPIVPVTPGGIG